MASECPSNASALYQADTVFSVYLLLMKSHPRVPHWWYLALLAVSAAISLGTIHGGGFELPWWGFIIMSLISWVFTFPNGILC